MHVINTLQAGGAELHLLTLCRSLKANGVTVLVVGLKNLPGEYRALRPEFEGAGIPVFELDARSRFDWSYLPTCLKLFKEEQPNIVHTHLPRADIVGVMASVSGLKVPWVCSIHDIYGASWSGRWALPVFNAMWRRADQLIAISEAVKTWLVTAGGQAKAPVQVVHYGIDAHPFERTTSDLRAALGLDGRPIVGSIGRLEARKGHDVLIRAMPVILQQEPDTILLIAGHDVWGYGKVLHALIDRLRLENSVRLVGFQDDVPAFLRTLDVFAFASHSEGFGQVVLEAMAASRPVVIRGKAPLTEIVKDRIDGRFVYGDAPEEWAGPILEYLKRPAEARLVGARAQQSVGECFTVERMTARTLALYDRVLRQG